MPGSESGLRVLILCDDEPGHAATVYDYLDAMQSRSRHSVWRFNPHRHDSRLLRFDSFDAVVVHWSLTLPFDRYIPRQIRAALRAYDGLKIQFIQDEYRWVDKTTAAMRDVGIDVVFSAVPSPAREQIYAERLPGVELRTTLTGFVPEQLLRRPVAPIAQRPVDIAYRGRAVPFALGALGYEKVAIAVRMLEVAGAQGLRADIAWDEDSRIYGEAWIDFVASARATLGTESGASIVDFDRACERAVDRYVREHPDADFEEVAREVLKPWEGNIVINVVSPRIFEAAALRTALVLHPGTYSGAVEADRHFIPLAKDFSNSDEVCERLRDPAHVQDLVDCAYEEVALAPRWQFDSMVADLDDVIERRAVRPRRATAMRFRGAQFERRLRTVFTLPRPPLPTRQRVGTQAARALATDVARAAFVARGTLPNGARRALARSAARACLSRELRPRTALEDLFAIGLIADAVSGRLAGYRFDLRLEHGATTAELVTRAPTTEPRAASAPQLDAETVYFWHNAGARVFAPLAPGISVPIKVGDERSPRHDLSGLLHAVPSDAVQGVLDDGFARESREPVAIRSMDDAAVIAGKAVAALRMLAAHAPLRALAAAWFKLPTGERPGLELLLDDVVKLVALREARRRGLHVDVEAGTNELVVRSRETAGQERDAQLLPGPWSDVRWDHSLVGATAPLPGRGVHDAVIGDHGRYRFAVLSALARDARSEVTAALDWALSADA